MRQTIFLLVFLIVGSAQNVSAQGWFNGSENPSSYSQSKTTNASITIKNRSDYSLTVKILKTNGRGLYRTVYISPRSSSTVTFSSSDNFYTKTMAVKDGLFGETLYRKGEAFSIQCDSQGYTEGTLEFYVSSTGGSSGQGISKSEFEKDY